MHINFRLKISSWKKNIRFVFTISKFFSKIVLISSKKFFITSLHYFWDKNQPIPYNVNRNANSSHLDFLLCRTKKKCALLAITKNPDLN